MNIIPARAALIWASSSDSELAHDTLAVPNDPVYFHEFSAHAGRHGLAYLAEAELRTMSATGLTPETRTFLTSLDPQAREQYLDFLYFRRFRQSLVKPAISYSHASP